MMISVRLVIIIITFNYVLRQLIANAFFHFVMILIL